MDESCILFLLESFLRTCSLWIRQSQMKALEKEKFSAESSVLTQKKQAVLDMETMTFSLESEADEDGDTISKGMILTTAGITSDTYPAVLTKIG